MLRSLEIRNYRNLRHLTIERLGRVNLLVGKNNTGKTSVLEAVAIFINEGSLSTLQELVEDRGYSIRNGTWEDVLKSYSSLFTDRPFPLHSTHILHFKDQKANADGATDIKIRIVGYVDRFEKDLENGYKRSTYQISDISEMYEQEIDMQLGIEVDVNNALRMTHLFSHAGTIKGNIKSDSINVKYQFIRSSGSRQPDNDSLWDSVTLTDNEDYVIQALQILDKNINRLAFVEDDQYSHSLNSSHDRKAVIRLRSKKDIIPLRSMGDGINRVLSIILAMVNCEDGYLLIDEFENGLHYSVQEKLWEIVFYLAKQLNIQVFATTHSLDCVEAFSSVLNNGSQDKDAGVMIRLENYEGNIEATVYDADEIQATTRVHVDPPMNEYINRKKFPLKLLVEGKDDLYVTASIRDKHQLPDNFEIIDCGGINKLPDQLIARIKLQRPVVNTIGIILDADTDVHARWSGIRDVLKSEGYEVPTLPDANGSIIEGVSRNPVIGVWLMPDNKTEPGMLEHFIERLIPDGDVLYSFALQILSTIERDGLNRYPLIHNKKALIHTWLAWQEEPGRPMGTAITATYLDHNAVLCQRFVNWLKRLFNAQ